MLTEGVPVRAAIDQIRQATPAESFLRKDGPVVDYVPGPSDEQQKFVDERRRRKRSAPDEEPQHDDSSLLQSLAYEPDNEAKRRNLLQTLPFAGAPTVRRPLTGTAVDGEAGTGTSRPAIEASNNHEGKDGWRHTSQ